VELVKESLNEMCYMAEMAGLSYSLDVGTDGIYISFGGYNHKIATLASIVFQRLRSLDIKRDVLDMCKEKLEKSYRNWSKEAPYQLAMYFTTFCVQEVLWTPDDKVGELDSVSGPEDLYAFMNDFFRSVSCLIIVLLLIVFFNYLLQVPFPDTNAEMWYLIVKIRFHMYILVTFTDIGCGDVTPDHLDCLDSYSLVYFKCLYR
jgi:hypothetical protein